MQSEAATAPPLARAAEAKISVLYSDYFEQIMPAPPRVCGRYLKPLSIGRYRRLARLRCAFVSDGERQATAGDLLLGVIVCSMRGDEFDKLIAQPDFHKQITKWGQKFGFFAPSYFSWPIIGKWLKKRCGDAVSAADAAYLTDQIGIFQKYIADGSPDLSKRFWNEPCDEMFAGTHWSQNIEAVMREFQGWTSEEIEEQPLSKALWDFYKHLENRGMGRFLSPDEIQALDTELTPEQKTESEQQILKIQEFIKKREEANG